MDYKSIDFVALWSLILGGASVLGLVALTFGPWGAQPSGQTAYALLAIGWLAFWMLGLLANNVAKILHAQADQIAALQQQLGEQSFRA